MATAFPTTVSGVHQMSHQTDILSHASTSVSFIGSLSPNQNEEHTFASSWEGAWRRHEIFHPSSTRFFYARSNDNLYLLPAGFTVFWLTGGKVSGSRLKSHANTLGTSQTFCSHGNRWLPICIETCLETLQVPLCHVSCKSSGKAQVRTNSVVCVRMRGEEKWIYCEIHSNSFSQPFPTNLVNPVCRIDNLNKIEFMMANAGWGGGGHSVRFSCTALLSCRSVNLDEASALLTGCCRGERCRGQLWSGECWGCGDEDSGGIFYLYCHAYFRYVHICVHSAKTILHFIWTAAKTCFSLAGGKKNHAFIGVSPSKVGCWSQMFTPFLLII